MTWAASADARTGTISNPIRSFQAFVHTAKSDASSVRDRKSTRLNSSHSQISYAVFCLKKKTHDIILASPRHKDISGDPLVLPTVQPPDHDHSAVRCIAARRRPAAESARSDRLHRLADD